MSRFAHLKLSEIRQEVEYQKAVDKVRAEQFRISNEQKERVKVFLNAQSKTTKAVHLKR